ncbi:MAG: hypothetical protein HYS98_01355 [Deltaproteobacteria bacterium]|nr:hypothetical protein [Deltaproteobacteria bacterium]
MEKCRSIRFFEKEFLKKSKKFENLVHCGIGGSAFGARAILQALTPYQNKVRILDNVDPMSICHVEDTLDPSKTLFHIVSKSGNTLETIAHYEWVCSWLSKNNLPLKNHILVSSDMDIGYLNTEVEKHGFSFFEIPKNVGGRYSVLTTVGLIPAAFAGIDVRALLEGAKSCGYKQESLFFHETLLDVVTAAYLLHHEMNHRVCCFLIYADELVGFGNWLVQLWSESLGQKKNLEGADVFEGSFPLVGRGTPAQHSLLQLLADGAAVSWSQFLTIKNWKRSKLISQEPSALLKDYSFAKLLTLEAQATFESLIYKKRPSILLEIQDISAHSLGALFYFYEWSVALLGVSLGIDPFIQPGVEDSKRRIRRRLQLNERSKHPGE